MTKTNTNKNTRGKYAFVTKKTAHRLTRYANKKACKA